MLDGGQPQSPRARPKAIASGAGAVGALRSSALAVTHGQGALSGKAWLGAVRSKISEPSGVRGPYATHAALLAAVGEIEAGAEEVGNAYEEGLAASDAACLAFEATLEDRACFASDTGSTLAAESLMSRMHIAEDAAGSSNQQQGADFS